MPNIIELNLLENKSIVATMQGYTLGNENSYKIIAGEENATQFIIRSIPTQYENARITVEMVNSKGYGIEETDIGTVEINGQEYKGFNLPLGMAVAGYGYILIRAYLESENVPFQPLKVKVWNTLPDWKEDIDSGINARVVNGYLIITENGIDYNVGYVSPVKGVDYWTDEDKQEIIDEVNAEIGGPYLTEETANEKYLPKPKEEYSSYRAVVMKLYQKNRDTGETDTLTVLMNGTFGFTYVQATGGANLAIAKAGETEIKEQWTGTRPICTDKLSLAVKVGVTKNTDTLTDEEKATAQTWLGVKKYYKHHLNFYKAGFSSFTLEFISSEATAYTNGGNAINEGLVGQNAKTIFLYNVYDPTGDNSGQAGFVVGSVAGYSNSDTDNGVYLSGAWSTNAGGAVKSIFDKIAIPFTSDTVTEI